MIDEFIKGRIKSLNIVTIPYNSSQILERIISEACIKKEKILYITNEAENDIDIIKYLNKSTNYYLYKGEVKVNSNFIISNYYHARKLRYKFDLIIYNDIRSYPEISSFEILDILDLLIKSDGKILYFGIEDVLKRSKDILIPVRDCRIPMFEPKIITTRVDITRDIPFVIFEYLKWSLRYGRKVIIYTPDADKTKSVYGYMVNYMDKLTKNIFRYTEIDKTDIIKGFANSTKAVLITNEFNELGLNMQDCDIMVFFADSAIFNYKKLLFLSCKGIRYPNKYVGEVIFLSKDETDEMDETRDLIRRFNKEAWEKGLLI